MLYLTYYVLTYDKNVILQTYGIASPRIGRCES